MVSGTFCPNIGTWAKIKIKSKTELFGVRTTLVLYLVHGNSGWLSDIVLICKCYLSFNSALRWKAQSLSKLPFCNRCWDECWAMWKSSMTQVAKQLKPLVCAVLGAALCLPSAWRGFIYLPALTLVLETELREKVAFGTNLSLSEFGWDETKKGK